MKATLGLGALLLVSIFSLFVAFGSSQRRSAPVVEGDAAVLLLKSRRGMEARWAMRRRAASSDDGDQVAATTISMATAAAASPTAAVLRVLRSQPVRAAGRRIIELLRREMIVRVVKATPLRTAW